MRPHTPIPAIPNALSATLAAVLLLAGGAPAARAAGDLQQQRSFTRTLAFSNPSGPRRLVVDDVWGSITVTGDDGADVRAEVHETVKAHSAERMAAARREVTLDVDERDNTARFYVDGPFRDDCGHIHSHDPGYEVSYDFTIRVPAHTDVTLKTVDGGEVKLTGVTGRYEVSNVNGGVEVREVAGSGHVRTVNGGVKVVFAGNPDAASSFTTVNGDVDLAFRSGLGAELAVKTFNGDTYAAFPVAVVGSPPPAAERDKGRIAYRRDRSMHLRVGAGGPALAMETINGDILIRNRDVG